MSEAKALVLGHHGEDNEWTSLRVSCGQCPFVTYTSRLRDFMPSASEILADHLAQHAPGRAVDIEVSWEPSAMCSVCSDGIGLVKIDNDGEGLECEECGTTWDIEGTGGERSEEFSTRQD